VIRFANVWAIVGSILAFLDERQLEPGNGLSANDWHSRYT